MIVATFFDWSFLLFAGETCCIVALKYLLGQLGLFVTPKPRLNRALRVWTQHFLIGLAAVPMSTLCLIASAHGVRESLAVLGSAALTLLLAISTWLLLAAPELKNELREKLFSAMEGYQANEQRRTGNGFSVTSGRGMHTPALSSQRRRQHFPTLDNLRNFLLMPPPEVLSFLQYLREAA